MPDTLAEHHAAGAVRGNALMQLLAHGQSCWLDDLTRRMLQNGEFADLVRQGVRGVTANPATFSKAIIEGREYDPEIARAANAGLGPGAIYERLAAADVRAACDVLQPAYDETDGEDGFVSLEVSPHLAHDTEASTAEAKRLWAAVDRPNLFIKIPGTLAGVPAIEQLLVDGINVNITLLFSVTRYEAVAQAYLKALERRRVAGQPIARIASVASFFLSRIDVLVDKLLQQRAAATNADPGPQDLLGKVAVANAKLAYRSFTRAFAGARWEALRAEGARVQRLLWASTGTKNPDYPDLMYVEPLIGPMTVNTMPLKTIAAFLDHGSVRDTVEEDIGGAQRVLQDLARLGIDFEAAAQQLEDEGVQKFIEPFDALLRHIDAKRRA